MATKEIKKEVKKDAKKEVKKDTKVKEVKAKEAKPAKEVKPAKEAKPAKAVKAEEKPVKEVKDVHELVFKEGKGWGVRRQGSDKFIKFFKTKVEATEYIVKVSGSQGTKVIVRLKNGKFQKFDNAMKALSSAKSSKDKDDE